MRFHLEYGGLNSVKAYGGLTGIYQHRNRRSRFMRREGYMAVKNLQELRKLMKSCSFAPTYLYHYVTYHTAAFPYILKKAAKGQEREAWDRFYVRLEEFMGLTIRNVWRMLITEKMKTANTGYIQRMEQKPDGTYGPAEYCMIALRKIVLSNGLCWVTEEYPDHEIMGSYEDVWDPCSRYGSGHLVWESSADSRIRSEFGEVNWEPYAGNKS